MFFVICFSFSFFFFFFFSQDASSSLGEIEKASERRQALARVKSRKAVCLEQVPSKEIHSQAEIALEEKHFVHAQV